VARSHFKKPFTNSSLIALSVAIPLVALNLGAQQGTKVLAPHRAIPPRASVALSQRPAIDRSIVGGFWTIDANRKASIYLKNGLETSPLTVTPVLFLSNGVQYSLAPVTLVPAGTAVVSVNDALGKQGIAPYATLSGYVEVRYKWAWDPVCATVVSVDPIHSVIFNYGLHPSDPTEITNVVSQPKIIGGKNVAEGIWWKPEPNVTGFVALSNTSSLSSEVSVVSSDRHNNVLAEQSVRIAPHVTKVVKLDELQSMPPGTAGGLRILYSGRSDGIFIGGGLEDQTSGYSAILPFQLHASAPPNPTGIESYAEVGLMTGEVDPMMNFPAETVFVPFSVVRNVGAQPLQVTPSFYWMQGGNSRSASLQPFTLQPLETRALDVLSLQKLAGLGGFNGSINLILDAQGESPSLLMSGGSVDTKNNYVFQVPPRAVGESASKTLSYWSTANGDDTMVTVWNPADESQDYVFTLLYAGGQHRTPIHLSARATQSFNISEIIQSQVPDTEGNVIPLTVHEGSAKISGPQADNQGILVVFDAGTYNVRKATCNAYCITCNGYTHGEVVTSPFTLVVGHTSQLSLISVWNTGYYYYFPASWSSTKTTVATVGSASSPGLVTGVGIGSTDIYANATENDYLYEPDVCSIDPTCTEVGPPGGAGPGNVTFMVQGNQYSSIFVGADPNLAAANTIFATDASPDGGTFTESSSASGDTFTSVQTGGPGWVVHTSTPSSGVTDRTLTFTYTVNNVKASQSLSVTARQFAYATNGSPGNTCSAGYGTTRSYTYTVYTHPDKTAVQPGIGVTGTAVTESFNPPAPDGTVTGNGSLDANSEYTDRISYCSNSPLTISTTITQSISIEGYQVRQNSLKYSTTGVTLTSLGPTQ
jgi:hypothetical protein